MKKPKSGDKAIEFDIKKTVKYWLDSAIYDMRTGKSLLQSKRFPYALFFGHIALEKLLKAIVVKKTKEHAPLPLLAEKSRLKIPKDYQIKLREFMEFHFESRYPDEQKSFYKKCTEVYTKAKMKEIREVFLWLKSRLQIK